MTDNTQADSGQQARSKHDDARKAEIDRLREQNARIRAAEITRGDYALNGEHHGSIRVFARLLAERA